MIHIRKLAALDMALHGARFIVVEFALGIILPFILGVVSVRAGVRGAVPSIWETVMGIWLITIAANYIPLLIYAVLIANAGTAKEEGQPEIAQAKRYGIQQVIILVPLLVVVAALAQELQQRNKR